VVAAVVSFSVAVVVAAVVSFSVAVVVAAVVSFSVAVVVVAAVVVLSSTVVVSVEVFPLQLATIANTDTIIKTDNTIARILFILISLLNYLGYTPI
jgi:hypothetical protein